MKRADKKRRARKFNVCKKICQLNRVATLFSIQYQEQAFQRKYLFDLYSTKIATTLDYAWNESEKYYNTIDSIYPEIKSKYHQIFAKKFKETKIDYNVFYQSTSETIQRRLQNVLKQIEFKSNEIISINEKVEKYHNPNYESKVFDGFIHNLNSLVKIQKQRFNNQKSKIFSTFNSKVSILKNESDTRIQKMITEKEIQKGLIKSSFPQSPENIEKYQRFNTIFLIPFRKRFKHYQFLFDGIENNFLVAKDTIEEVITSAKTQIFKEIDKIRRLHKKMHSERKEILREINHDSLSNDKSIESIKSELLAKTNEYEKEEENAKKQHFENQQKFENSIQFLELNQKGRLSNVDTIFAEIQKNQRNEINSLKLKFNHIEKNAKNRISQIEIEIFEFVNNKDSIEQALQNEIESIKLKNSNEIDQIKIEFEKEEGLLNNEFQQKKNDIQKKNLMLLSNLNDLKNEKKEALKRFDSYNNNINNEEKKEIENLTNNFKFEISELRTELSNNIYNLSQRLNEDIKKVQIECDKKKNEKLKQYEFLHNHEIIKIQFNIDDTEFNSISEKKYLKEINDYYSNIFNQCKEKLNSISPPSFNDNYARLTVEISGLNKELNDHIEIIDKERSKLNEAFNSKIEKEKERHLCKVKEQEVRQEKESELNELRSLHNNSGNDDQKEYQRKLDLIELNYLKQKTIKMKEIESIQNEINQKKVTLKNSIEELKKSFDVQLRPLQNKLNSILKKKRAIFSHSPNSNIPFEELVIKKMRSHKEKVKKLKDLIHDVQTAQQIGQNEYEHRLFVNKQKHKKNFQSNEAKLKDELNQLITKKNELKASLINSVSNDGDDINPSPSSSSKHYTKEKIERLTVRLNKANQMLTTVLAEYKQCKALFESQDNRMNSSFGGNQAVPAIQLSPIRHTASPKY